MPRLQVYLPDDLHRELKRRGLPASELLQQAVRAEVRRLERLEATDAYLAANEAAARAATAADRERADIVARRIGRNRTPRAGARPPAGPAPR